ncbi:MAG TPA: ADP-ribosylglycohydrolase family protein [Ktedonobacterales bacterium]|nr:ADP-ribosylglycohydrolase family protein [Ktedonobacterales bacterium]
MNQQEDRLARAHTSLEGLSVGDAFGERFFTSPAALQLLIGNRALPATPWPFTDDTQMALSIVEVLGQHDGIDQDTLAFSFGQHYDRTRAYGPAMHRLLPLFRAGTFWQHAAYNLFGGEGSFGNGSAMRVAPVGAYFADDLDAATTHAARSAEVTHTHPEAAAGAIAVAVAAALAWQAQQQGQLPAASDFLDHVLPYVPESAVRAKIVRARDFRPNIATEHAAAMLGNGSEISCQDTVPFCLWCAAHHLDDYEEALWQTVSALGDRDTTCAIVGGIVVMYTGVEGIPPDWRAAREPLPDWAL